VVDDEEGARRVLEQLLRADGFSTSGAADGAVALAEARRALPDVVLTDLQMPWIHGVELCQRLHEIEPDLPVIVMTAHSNMKSVIESLRVGAEDYLIKPFQYEAVLWCVERAIARRTAKLEQEHLRQQNEELYRTLAERLVLSSVREQEHAEAEGQQRAQLTALLENLKEGVVIADQGGRLLMINGAARAILGAGDDLHTIDELHSQEAHDVEGHPLSTEQRPLMRALRGEQFVDYEVLRLRPNGEQCRVVSTGTSVRDENGDVALAIVVFRDVTELRHPVLARRSAGEGGGRRPRYAVRGVRPLPAPREAGRIRRCSAQLLGLSLRASSTPALPGRCARGP
jgi:PAS domain S-box-containing protein